MPTNDMTFLFGGAAGQGIESNGAGFAKALARTGLHVVAVPDYMSRIRGGHNFYQIRVSEQPILTHEDPVHLVMALGYGMAAHDLERHSCLVVFAVAVKTIATVFLLVYWLFVSSLPIVLLSGIGDGLLAAALAWLYAAWRGKPAPAAGHRR